MSISTILSGQPDKRRRRTREQIEQLNDQIVDVLREDHPQSVRHVFYRMTDPRLSEPVEKTDAGYEQVQARLVKLRREGTIPYGWIADMSRRGYFVNTFNGASDFIRRMRGLYRSDLWTGADHYVEVWVESRSIASVIQEDCKELAVSLYPCAGFASISFVHDAAVEINSRDDGRPVTVFYVGDYDPAGVLIDVALENELRRHLRSKKRNTASRPSQGRRATGGRCISTTLSKPRPCRHISCAGCCGSRSSACCRPAPFRSRRSQKNPRSLTLPAWRRR